jgi:hypothetical protein
MLPNHDKEVIKTAGSKTKRFKRAVVCINHLCPRKLGKQP